MKIQSLIIPLLLAVPLTAQLKYSEQDVVRYARALDVRKLDAALSSQPLEEWLRTGPPHVDQISWRMSPDCDLKEPPNGVVPLCVKISFERRGVVGSALIRVGTFLKGISGKPRLEYFQIFGGPSRKGRDKLSDLPWALDNTPSPPKSTATGHH